MVGMALQTVIAQRLVRRNCNACLEPMQPTAAQRAWLDLQLGAGAWDETGLKRGRGCPRCRNVGFDGRHGLYEVLAMNGEMVAALLRNDMSGFNAAARAAIGTHSLVAESARAAVRGVTTVAEAMRIGLRSIG
jgi:MSHA biogenesis protein MshE